MGQRRSAESLAEILPSLLAVSFDPNQPRIEPGFERAPAAAEARPNYGIAPADFDPLSDEALAAEAQADAAEAEAAEAAAAEAAAPAEGTDGFSGAGLTKAYRQLPISAARPSGHVARNPSLPTFVGLIMLILTFFIVLTSISMNDRKKSDAALQSVQSAFSGSAMLRSDDGNDAARTARDIVAGLTDRIQSLVPLMGGEQATVSRDQVLWLPLNLAFAADQTKLQAEFTPILQELLNAAAKIPARFDYHVELRLCDAEAGDRLRQRATALIDGLTRLQAPLERFVIGSQACQVDRMAFAVALTPLAPLPPAETAQ
jgi:outer membrane protein OmpA-like peptidoglycan-associated protein